MLLVGFWDTYRNWEGFNDNAVTVKINQFFSQSGFLLCFFVNGCADLYDKIVKIQKITTMEWGVDALSLTVIILELNNGRQFSVIVIILIGIGLCKTHFLEDFTDFYLQRVGRQGGVVAILYHSMVTDRIECRSKRTAIWVFDLVEGIAFIKDCFFD